MTALWKDSWFIWTVGVAVGLPVSLVLLTELHNSLVRRRSGFVRPVALIRNYILPLGALLVLLVKGSDVSIETTPVRIVATVLGFIVVVLLLSSINTTLFHSAPEGSWRDRIPKIFLDVARFALIAVGLAMILSYIWGANIGGMFAALGVTSIVLGLALQNSLGQVISGLFLLFEQPFELGDWLAMPDARGRIVEVNWRATHIETSSGVRIMPNSLLAEASFINLSRPPGAHTIEVTTTFGLNDPPDAVCAMLTQVAGSLPYLRSGNRPVSITAGSGGFCTAIPLRSPADDAPARAAFFRWVWYASRRAGLHLGGAADDFCTPERIEWALQTVGPILRVSQEELEQLRPTVRVVRYGADEMIQSAGQVPKAMTFVLAGRVRLTVTADAGQVLQLRTLNDGEFLGQTTLTREPVHSDAHAMGEVTALQIDRDTLENLVMRKPALLQDLGRVIDERRDEVAIAFASLDQD
jgi:small-conductance mechanosensitive channel